MKLRNDKVPKTPNTQAKDLLLNKYIDQGILPNLKSSMQTPTMNTRRKTKRLPQTPINGE